MKKGLLFTSVTALILLTSCGKYGTDLPKKYKGFIDYAYGEDGYTVEETRSSEETGQKEWYVTFSDKNGSEHSAQLLTNKYENEKEYFDSKKAMDMGAVYSLYTSSVSYIAEKDICDNVISKFFKSENHEENERVQEGDGFRINILSYSVVDTYDERCASDIEKRVNGKDCMKISEVDGKTVGSDKEYVMRFVLTIYDESRKDEFLEKAEALIDEYEEYVENPQNYWFSVVLSKGDSVADRETIMQRSMLFGEDFDLEARKAELGKDRYSVVMAVTDALYGE